MTTDVVKGRRWTCEMVEDAFRAFAIKHHRPPKWSELGTEGLPWPRTVERLYEGSFRKAVAAAGMRPRPIGQPRIRVGRRAR